MGSAIITIIIKSSSLLHHAALVVPTLYVPRNFTWQSKVWQ